MILNLMLIQAAFFYSSPYTIQTGTSHAVLQL